MSIRATECIRSVRSIHLAAIETRTPTLTTVPTTTAVGTANITATAARTATPLPMATPTTLVTATRTPLACVDCCARSSRRTATTPLTVWMTHWSPARSAFVP